MPLARKTPSIGPGRVSQLAEEKVYVAEIRKQILAADHEQNPSDQGLLVQLPDGYRDRAHEIGKLRVVQGGYRTAEFFRNELEPMPKR